MFSNWARVSVSSRLAGPFSVSERYGSWMLVDMELEEQSFFACSAASLRRCRAILSFETSTPVESLKLLDQVLDDALVPVVAAEAVVAGGRAHLDGREVVVLAHLEQGDVEGAAAEVEDEDELVFLALVEAVGEGGRGGLVDDAQHVEARDLAGLLGGLALGVVEVRRDGDDRVGDRLAEVLLGVALELLQDARRDLLRACTSCRRSRPGPVGAHVALDRGDGAVDVGDGLALGGLADQHLAVLGEGDDGRGGAEALGVGDDGGLATLEDGHDGVGGAEVDTYCS